MRLIDADRSDEIIVFDKQNELLQCSVVRDYCERQREFLNKFPTIDAEPVVHGRWIKWDDESTYDCSICGDAFTLYEGTPKSNHYNYCPNCGAKMDEVNNHA